MQIIDKFSKRLTSYQTTHPWRFLGILLFITIIFGAMASQLVFDSSYEALLPLNAENVKNADKVRSQTGGTRQLIVAISGKTPETRLAYAKKLKEKIKSAKEIRYVDVTLPAEFIKDHAVWLMPTATLDELTVTIDEAVKISRKQANPFYLGLDKEADKRELETAWGKVDDVLKPVNENTTFPADGSLVSKDQKYTFISVIPSFRILDLMTGKKMIGHIDDAVAKLNFKKAGLKVRYAGTMAVFHEQHAVMSKDLRNASILALVFGILVVAGFTRKIAAPFLIGVALVSGVVWTFGMAFALVGNVNVITGFLGAILFGLGIDFCIHLYVRYLQERDNGLDAAKALENATTGTLPPAVTSALTTAGTFLSFIIAEFRGFSEFGLIAGIGVLLTMFSAFFVLPPLIFLTDRNKTIKATVSAPKKVKNRSFPVAIATGVIAAFIALAIFGGINANKIVFRNNFAELRGELPATDFFNYVNENIGAGFNPAVFITDNIEDTRRLSEMLRNRIDHPKKKKSLMGKVLSITDLLPNPSDAHAAEIRKLRTILDDPSLDKALTQKGKRADQLREGRKMALTEPWTVKQIPNALRRRLLTLDNKKYITYVWPEKRVDSDLWLLGWEDELYDISAQLKKEHIQHRLADETLTAAWINRIIVADATPLFIAASIVMLFFLIIDFKKPGHVALVTLALMVGMLGFAGVMHLLHKELNLFNIIVIPSIIGIGVDNAIHIFHRYKTEGPGTVLRVMRYTGAAALLASLTTGVGFGSSLISHNAGLRSMGELAVLGIATTFLSAVVFFPAVLRLLEKLMKKA